VLSMWLKQLWVQECVGEMKGQLLIQHDLKGGGNCEFHGHLHIGFYLGRSHVGSNDSNYKIIKVSVDVSPG